jgi:gliding motility-associated-like protein
MNKHLVLLLLWSWTSLLWAQPVNDECINAIPLTDLNNWCSEPEAFTNEGATTSPEANPSCFPATQESFDVWFSFVAQANTVGISVFGDLDFNEGGTLRDPQFALYTGDCDDLTIIACQSDGFNADQISLFQSQLDIGTTYYIRVGARIGQTGTFQLCINNFNEVPTPSGDCEPGVILCDKSPFTVPQLTGVGMNPNEIDDAICAGGTCPGFNESGSTWYKWTCDQPGSLTFTLTPQNPSDDLDFVVYELPNGIDDCSGKFALRCMASGENVGEDFSEWFPCTGATGLSEADPDFSESCGCSIGDNNFLSALDMEAGKSYALVINNFSQSGAGFSIEFGGTGTFLGPTAGIQVAPIQVCIGETVTFADASSYIGDLVEWRWNFGANASETTAAGEGPFEISYDRPGIKNILLQVTADRGCVVSELVTIEVVCCDDHFSTDAAITNLTCPGDEDGAIDLSVVNDYGPYAYDWSNGAVTEDISGLAPGTYTVDVVDQATCTTSLSYTVNSPPPFVFDTLVTMPTCNGGTDGAVTLVVEGGTPPYEFDWGSGFSPANSLNNISQGDYPVTIRDANGCIIEQVLPVRELELILDPTVQAITPPSCFGFSDASIQVNIANGLPPYQYNFNTGNGYVDENILNNLPSGTYLVDVLDANLCAGMFELVIEDPAPVALDLEVENVSCFGLSDGQVTAIASGGVGNYSYAWSNGPTTPVNDQLPAGTYGITVEDGNGCPVEATAVVTQPDSLGISVIDIVDNICFGESLGSITVAASGGTGPYEYSLDGFSFQTDPTLANLAAGIYTITVLDAMGCTATTVGEVTQPVELLADAGPDVFIQLGFDTTLRATSNYFPVSFDWSPLDSLDCLSADCDFVRVDPTNTTTYQVLVTNEAGCTTLTEVTVFVIKDRPVYVPNAFSPNGDGANDGFTVFGGPGLERIEKLQIFSRWGSLVFETNNIDPNDERLGWDGTFKGQPVNPGVFVYIAQLRFVDQEVIQVEGDVTVIR